MEMKYVYLLWAVLPATLFLMALRAGFQKARKSSVQEQGGFYLEQAVYALILLLFCLVLDIFVYDAYIAQAIEINTGTSPELYRWLLYPVVLVIGVTISDKRNKKQK